MKKMLSFAILDYKTVKEYFSGKNLLILLAIGIFLGVSTDSSILIGLVVMYGIMYSVYPFMISEQSGIDTLYSTLSIDRKTVVFGRYLFGLSLTYSMGIIATILNFILSVFLNRSFSLSASLTVLAICLAVFGLLQAFQVPIYFKLSYAKAKFAAYLPLLAFPLATYLTTFAISEEQMQTLTTFIANNSALLITLAIIIYIVIYAVSIVLSVQFYKKRDF